MRKHFFSLLFLVVAGAIWWSSISSSVRNPYADDKNPVVVTSGYVPYTLTKQLAGPYVNVSMLLPPNAEPHAFEPAPGVLVRVKQAQAFIYLSDELEPWAADVARVAPANVPVVVLATAVPPSQDPHVWMKLENAKLLAEKIVQTLQQIDPVHRVQYQENLAAFNKEIDQLAQDYSTTLATCAQREVVHIGHLAFENLTAPYGLTLTALAGTSHEGEQSAQKLAALIDQIKRNHIHTIFTEGTISPRLAQTVARETGAQLLELYPIEHISKQDFNNNVTYADLMRRNLASLKRGLSCSV